LDPRHARSTLQRPTGRADYPENEIDGVTPLRFLSR